MTVYVVYSVNYPYLPVAVFDTQKECAAFLGVDRMCLQKYISQPEHIYGGKFIVRKVKIPAK